MRLNHLRIEFKKPSTLMKLAMSGIVHYHEIIPGIMLHREPTYGVVKLKLGFLFIVQFHNLGLVLKLIGKQSIKLINLANA